MLQIIVPQTNQTCTLPLNPGDNSDIIEWLQSQADVSTALRTAIRSVELLQTIKQIFCDHRGDTALATLEALADALNRRGDGPMVVQGIIEIAPPDDDPVLAEIVACRAMVKEIRENL